MDDIERPISERATGLDVLLTAMHRDCYPREERLAAIQQALDESFEDGISEYITTNPPRDR